MQLLITLLLPVLLLSCDINTSGKDMLKNETGSDESGDSIPSYNFLFDPLLANGFDYPFGDVNGKGSYVSPEGKKYEGWYMATQTGDVYSLGIHTGEDWNGTGGGNSDLGQPVFATAKGKVLAAHDYGMPWGNIVYLSHTYLENGKIKKCFSLYAHLNEILVKEGEVVERRQNIGTIGTGGGAYPAHLHFEIRKPSMEGYEVDYWPSSNSKDVKWVLENYEKPSQFVNAHRKLTVPAEEKLILIAVKGDYKMHVMRNGKRDTTYEIALSQDPIGHKQRQGDNRLPEGEYKIIEKSRGPFSGDYSDYFGTGWMRINYPNAFDAEAGCRNGLISTEQKEKIIAAIKTDREPPKTTKLGGGIGIHGWSGDWTADGTQNLTWGCISMHNEDMKTFQDLITVPVKIIILP